MTAEAKKVDYIVIGPVHKKVQMTTGTGHVFFICDILACAH